MKIGLFDETHNEISHPLYKRMEVDDSEWIKFPILDHAYTLTGIGIENENGGLDRIYSPYLPRFISAGELVHIQNFQKEIYSFLKSSRSIP